MKWVKTDELPWSKNFLSKSSFPHELHKKRKFSIYDLVTFNEEIFNGKLHFLCNDDGIFWYQDI